MKRHIISVWLENEAGALARVATLFAARGYNIESLAVAPTEDLTQSRMTLVALGDNTVVEQITKQLNKLVDVARVVNLTEGPHNERELMMVKVRAEGAMREELKRLTDIFRGRIIDIGSTHYVIEVTGESAKMNAFLDTLDESLILETVRSGPLGIARGRKTTV